MRPATAILIIALLILAAALPVSAAQEKPGKSDNGAGPAGDNPGQDRNGRDIASFSENRTLPAREENRTERKIDTPIENRTQDRLENQEEHRGNATAPGQNLSGRHAEIRQDRERLNATLRNATPVRAGWSRNENQVRLAVHTLLAMENITGGIGQQVSAIARDFNNSAQKTWQLEEQIRNRDGISRFFFGGDQVSAGELANLTASNQNRIRQIEQLMNAEDLDTETRAMLEEQVRIIQEENTRLGQLASAEQQNHGLLGWFGK